MSFLQCASHYNNEGVRHLQQDHFNMASKLFQAALSSLRSQVAGAPLLNKISTTSNNGNSGTLDDAINATPLQLIRDLSAESADTKYYLYKQGILLDETDASSSLESRIALFCCTVLFNLALLSHKEGLSGKESKMKLSLALYYKCATILEDTQILQDTSMRVSNSACCQLQSLLYNNMAHAHLNLCDYDSFRACLERVALVVSHYKDMLSQISTFPMNPIMLNLFLLTTYPVACAA
jgi:hypothetical protein